MPTMARIRRSSDRNDEEAQPILVFYRAAREGIRYPSDLVSLLKGEGVRTGRLRARNPTTHDQWWIPILAAAGAPYARALASVLRTWLKERNGRKVELQNGRVKITAATPAQVERLLSALTKHQTDPAPLHVTKAGRRPPANKANRPSRQ
jgi:hypothetical protein